MEPLLLVQRQDPKFFMGMTIQIKDQPAIHYTYTGEVPKEIMDAYQQIVGNALARVSVSADMGIKDFGTGASAMVAVSLSCNQDGATIQQAIQMAGQLARGFANQQRAAAEAELEAIISQKKLAQENQTNSGPRY
jgi:hypothetical protein